MRIEMRGIDKSFGSNQVLKQAGFTLESGEVSISIINKPRFHELN